MVDSSEYNNNFSYLKSDRLYSTYSPKSNYDSYRLYSTIEDDRDRIRNLTSRVQDQSEENLHLRNRLENAERDRDDLTYELNKLDREYEVAHERLLNKENELQRNKLLTREKNNLEDLASSYRVGTVNKLKELEEDFLTRENRKLKENNIRNEMKIDLLTRFFNKMQNLVLAKDGRPLPFVLLENMDMASLKGKLVEMEDEIEKLVEANRVKSKGLVLGNSEIINYKFKDLKEENEYLKKKIETLNPKDFIPQDRSVRQDKSVRHEQSVRSDNKGKSNRRPEEDNISHDLSNSEVKKQKEPEAIKPKEKEVAQGAGYKVEQKAKMISDKKGPVVASPKSSQPASKKK